LARSRRDEQSLAACFGVFLSGEIKISLSMAIKIVRCSAFYWVLMAEPRVFWHLHADEPLF